MSHALVRYAGALFGFCLFGVGIQHFTNTTWFEPIVPGSLGNPALWVWLTGIMEISLGLGLMLQRSQRSAALFTAAFLVGVYWANLNMWLNGLAIGGQTYGHLWHIGRLFAQIGMVGLCLWIAAALDEKPHRWDEPLDD